MRTAVRNGISDGQIAVELLRLPSIDDLGTAWRDLEQRSECSFFTSWRWIGCWLDSLAGAAELLLLRACREDRIVGMGILSLRGHRRNGVIVSRTLHLHATGSRAFDILAVECNSFVVEQGLEEHVSTRMLGHLIEHEKKWDELALDGLSGRPNWPLGDSRTRVRINSQQNHYIALEAVRKNEGGYLSLLGAKTRSRIRRSIREYEQFGPVIAHLAKEKNQALLFLDGLKALHQKYWMGRGEAGAFANPFFDRFHHKLVHDSFDTGEVQIIAVDAGDRRLGYIYNFVYRGRIYNYQSGFNYQLCERHNRPGLVAHACAVELNARSGHEIYDFLAGDSEYKQALGTAAASMSWVVVQRDRLRFRLEAMGRKLRDRIRPPAPPLSGASRAGVRNRRVESAVCPPRRSLSAATRCD
jgi:CelD/BcsL family acetyltransferase involved in cellulose biosynthesis